MHVSTTIIVRQHEIVRWHVGASWCSDFKAVRLCMLLFLDTEQEVLFNMRHGTARHGWLVGGGGIHVTPLR